MQNTKDRKTIVLESRWLGILNFTVECKANKYSVF